MMLISIQHYFMNVKSATLSHLIQEFKIEEQVLQSMLTFLVNKGKLKKVLAQETHCTQCTSCKLGCFSLKRKWIQPTDTYEWMENG